MLSDTSINVSPMENQETDVPDGTHGLSAGVQSPFPNKYIFDPFAGYEGERLLKSILHKILPMALYRTWEVLVERQAPGNDCFLSIASISETTQRVERTIRLNIHAFEKRKLMELRAEQKLLRQADGSYKLKLVVVKDFSGLYALALEYLLWTQSDTFIEAERDFAEIIQSNAALKRKLIRFNNYRRLIENKVPGPKPVEREEYRRYTEYNPALDDLALGTVGGTSTPPLANAAQQAGNAEEQSSSAIGKLNLQEQLSKDLKKVSEERTTTSNQNNLLNGDSFDSEIPLGGRGGRDYTKNPNVSQTEEEVRRDSHNPTTKPTKTNPYPGASEEMGGAKQAGGKRSKQAADLDERAKAFVQQALAVAQGAKDKGNGQNALPPKVKQNALVSAFVREVSPLFRDLNGKGSRTRALRAVEQQTHLSQKEILACLVKAYLVAQETKTVQPQHRHPEGDNKMPLFCTMFARFVDQCSQGKFGYSDEHLARDIAEDDRLVLFVVEHQLEATLLEDTAAGEEIQGQQWQAPSSVEEENNTTPLDGAGDPMMVTEREAQAEAEQLQDPQEQQQPYINVKDPNAGWRTYESAQWWADRLRDQLGRDYYSYDICPTQYERYGFVLFERGNASQHWVYLTKDQVDLHM